MMASEKPMKGEQTLGTRSVSRATLQTEETRNRSTVEKMRQVIQEESRRQEEYWGTWGGDSVQGKGGRAGDHGLGK